MILSHKFLVRFSDSLITLPTTLLQSCLHLHCAVPISPSDSVSYNSILLVCALDSLYLSLFFFLILLKVL